MIAAERPLVFGLVRHPVLGIAPIVLRGLARQEVVQITPLTYPLYCELISLHTTLSRRFRDDPKGI